MKTLFGFDENSSATFLVLGGVQRRKQCWNKSKIYALSKQWVKLCCQKYEKKQFLTRVCWYYYLF